MTFLKIFFRLKLFKYGIVIKLANDRVFFLAKVNQQFVQGSRKEIQLHSFCCLNISPESTYSVLKIEHALKVPNTKCFSCLSK